jgi:(4S)-4-hydroxy-5-phosphonooxypentane-2,3-dione isomerase
MGAYVILVDFRLKPGAKNEFRRLIDANARESCRNEPGCRRFDVLELTADADRILLYEIYDDRAAFEDHLKTSHYDLFNRRSAEHVTGKQVTVCDLVCEGSADWAPAAV